MNKFIKSATKLRECPPPDSPEVAFLGRSNAGKSSLLNALFGKGLAKVSGRPGHTRLMNFFDIEGLYRAADLPGYGYAQGPSAEVRSWKDMLEDYLRGRDSLKALILVMDSRRNWQDEEQELLDWLSAHRQLPLFLVLTKRDKLNQKELSQRRKYFSAFSGAEGPFFVSNSKGTGVKELKLAFEKILLA